MYAVLYRGITLTALVCLLLLGGCASRMMTPHGTPAPAAEAERLWASFTAYNEARAAEQGPYRLKGSLRYGDEGDTRRVSYLLWSNGGLPVRLDVLAGINTVAARLFEAPDEFIAYAPGESKAVTHQGRQRVQLNFGKPVPFALRDFAALMRGRFAEVFGPALGTHPELVADGGIAYTLEDGFLSGILTLNASGLPIRWEAPGDGWLMTIDYDEGTPNLPYKFRLTRTGYTALLLVKDREHPEQPFSSAQMNLRLPPDTVIEQVKKQ